MIASGAIVLDRGQPLAATSQQVAPYVFGGINRYAAVGYRRARRPISQTVSRFDES